MNHDASGKHVLSKSSEGNQNKLCKAAVAGQDTRTTHSLTRSGVWEGQEYRTVHHQCNLLSYVLF